MVNKENEKLNVGLPLLLSAMLAIGMLVGYVIHGSRVSSLVQIVDAERNKSLVHGGVEEVLRMVENRYIDTIDRQKLEDICVRAIVGQLDPHTLYLDNEKVEDVKDEMEGIAVGMGIEVDIHHDSLIVEHVISDGPAAIAGLKQFDYIVSVEDSIISGRPGLDFAYAKNLVEGDPGDKLEIVYLREGVLDTVQLVLDNIPVPSVETSFMLDSTTAYIHVSKFTRTTYKEFMEVLDDMYTQGQALNLVLDLRGNPGGYLPEATNILNQLFREKDKLFVYTEGRNTIENEYRSTGKPFFTIENVAVLIDENSASGSEIIAGAIQDLDRGIVIGRRSYGKGLIQEQYNLSSGGALRLTVAKYYTASGRCIQRDFKNKEEYLEDYARRIDRGALYSKDSTYKKEEKVYYTTGLKRPVYGGGGVEPDVFVPLEKGVKNDEAVKDMIRKSVLYTFARRQNHPDKHTMWKAICADFSSAIFSCDTLDANVKKYYDMMYLRFKDGKQAMKEYRYKNDAAVLKALDYIEGRIELPAPKLMNGEM